MTPTTTHELGLGDKLTFSCTFAGYPIKEIKITDPASKPISCPGSKDNITCTEKNTNKYIVSISYFELSLQGKYRCTITSEFTCLIYLIEFIRRIGRVIRCLTTSLACSLPMSLTNCSCSRRPEGCPVSKQEISTC